MNVCRVGLALDDVENADVAAGFAGVDRDHAVLGLQQPTHYVQHRCLAHCLGLVDVVACEGCVRCEEEVAARRGDQRGDDPDEVVVHVPRVTECGCRSGHDGRNLLLLASYAS